MTSSILVTGGAGFIGSHMIDFLLQEYPGQRVICIDKLTYACFHLTENLADALENPKFCLLQWDLADYSRLFEFVVTNWDQFQIKTILHFAAESCVDRSFNDPLYFTQNNVIGLQNLLECYRILLERVPQLRTQMRFVHISTDEVYGEQEPGECATEEMALSPSTPYAATKAACDLIVNAYCKSFNVPVTIIRPNNIYGPRQFPEKLVSVCLEKLRNVKSGTKLDDSEKIPLHGLGEYTRMYLHVSDFVRAVDVVLKSVHKQENGNLSVYNVGTEDEILNISIVKMIIDSYLETKFGNTASDYSQLVTFVKDRNYNDKRYSVDSTKIKSLGWTQMISLKDGIVDLVRDEISRTH